MENKTLYFDYASSTPCDEKVLKEMYPYFTSLYANPSNVKSNLGAQINKEINKSRKIVADLINARPHNIFWTSGATESNNLSLLGTCLKNFSKDFKWGKHIITSQIEHKSVLRVVKHLESIGYRTTYLAPGRNGLISSNDVLSKIEEDTLIVSLMYANNEIGTINAIEEIGKDLKKVNSKIIFHTDATQYFGRYPIDVVNAKIDLLTFSGHKIYGPKGIGGIFVNPFIRQNMMTSLVKGGGHEEGIRSGTLNTPGIIGIGEAAKIYKTEAKREREKMLSLQSYFETKLKAFVPTVKINCNESKRVCHISSVTFDFNINFSLIDLLQDMVISSGSACDNNDLQLSHVLRSIGLKHKEIKNTLRVSFGRNTTIPHIDHLISRIVSINNNQEKY